MVAVFKSEWGGGISSSLRQIIRFYIFFFSSPSTYLRKFGAGSVEAAPVSAAPSNSNPFAFATLTKPAAAPPTFASSNSGSQQQQVKPNPFANVALTSTSATTTPPPKFLFTSNAAAPQPTTATVNENLRQLNVSFLQTIIDHWEGHHRTCDYSTFMRDYNNHVETLLELGEDDESNNVPPPSLSAFAGSSTASQASVTNNNSQPSIVSWSFGATAPAPSLNDKSSESFSFTSKLAPASTTTGELSALPYFGSTLSAPSSTNSANINHGSEVGGEDDNSTVNPDDGRVEKIEREENNEEDILYEVRAKHLKRVDNEWKRLGGGVLRLYRHKAKKAQRIVIRNEIGKVQFNVAVSNGMEFNKVVQDSRKGRVTYVKFVAVEDALKGPEVFMLQVKPEFLDDFHRLLTDMAAC